MSPKKNKVSGNQFPFYELLKIFYDNNKGKIRKYYKVLSKKYLDYNDKAKRPEAWLRKPQFEALEMYVFIKEFLDNKQMYEIFEEWRAKDGKFSDATYYSSSYRAGQLTLYDTEAKDHAVFFRELKKIATDYPNYIYALAMGLGKTILMATCIFYEFLLANKFPKDEKYCHNALVFAPDLTVLQSLREIVTFDKRLVVPEEYADVLNANMKFHFLDQGNTLNTLDQSEFNIIISNVQKIIIKRKTAEESPANKLFTQSSLFASSEIGNAISFIYGESVSEANITLNQRFEKLSRLPQLGIYVDEAHHLFGADLEKALRKSEDGENTSTSLRNTIDLLSRYMKQQTEKGIVACYNFTGTPYIENSILPEVVYSYGLNESIQNEYLKRAKIRGYDNVKEYDFLKTAIKEFWKKYGEKTYEGLNPKLAIFGSRVAEIRNEVLPMVEEILAELNIPRSKILINLGDKETKDADIGLFNNLDRVNTDGNEKQFILLVNKGREGWNCRSLFGVALYRNLKGSSKVFVLQATMRCLRKITDEQQEASIFLSEDNFKILDEELNKNFRLKIDDLSNDDRKEKNVYRIRVNLPERKIKVKTIRYLYTCKKRENPAVLDLELQDTDFSPYESKIYTKELGSQSSIQEKVVQFDQEYRYNIYTLTGEIARYLHLKPSLISKLLKESNDGITQILDAVNKYNDIIYNLLIPKIFNHLYEISSEKITEEKVLSLLRYPVTKGYYEFTARPEMVVKESDSSAVKYVKKSFHSDIYCFDSKPEIECFWQYIRSPKVKEVYFTGMFTSNQGDFSIPYIDQETRKLRKYYPDFIAHMEDGTYQIIEVKGDNHIDDDVVLEKKSAAQDIASESKMEYIIYKGSDLMRINVLGEGDNLNL